MIDDDSTLQKEKKHKLKNQIKQLDAYLNTNGQIKKEKKVNLWQILGILGIISSFGQALFIFTLMPCHTKSGFQKLII